MATRLGMRIKQLRTKQGLSVRDLAEKVGVSHAYISMLETGAKTNPSLDLVKQLAKALKVKLTELLG